MDSDQDALLSRRREKSESEYTSHSRLPQPVSATTSQQSLTLRRLFLRLNRPRRRWLVFFIKCSLIALFVFLAAYLFVYRPIKKYFWETNHAANLAFLRHDRCPACFGQSMCVVLQSGAIQLKGIYQYPIFDSYNVRNVIHGTWRRGIQRDVPVVLKKLGHAQYIRSVHAGICFQIPGRDRDCDTRGALWLHLGRDGDEQVSLAHAQQSRTDLATCMSERLLEKFKQTFRERVTDMNANLILRLDQLKLLYTIKMNSEPLLLQAFPYDRHTWPFVPRYHGACGQWVVVEDRGQTLASFVETATLQERITIAAQLLELAKDFTEGQDDFIFYLGDVHWENFVVDEAIRVSLIDLSNVLVIDKHEHRRMDKSRRVYKAPFDPCPPDNVTMCRMTWDIERLCDAEKSDYNFYAICRTFLSPSAANEHRIGGLIPDLVNHPVAANTGLQFLLDRCANPRQSDSRVKIAANLLTLLHTLQKEITKREKQNA